MGYDIPADHHGSLPRENRNEQRNTARLQQSLSFAEVVAKSIARANRWHNGNMDEWSALEWAAAMCGEAGECANAAKKLKRLECTIKSINDDFEDEKRHFTNVAEAREAIGKEVADTILYAVLVAARVGYAPSQVEGILRKVFNKKSEEYGFPERL